MSTENIGLARTRDGLDLIRIGAPLRPEFAAWRYGHEFRRRRLSAIAAGTSAAGAVTGIVLSSPIIALTAFLWPIYELRIFGHLSRRSPRPTRVVSNMGEPLEISPLDWGSPRLRPGGGHEGSWQLEVEHGPFVQPQGPSFDSQLSSEGWSRPAARSDRFVPRRSAVLTGRAAEHALAILLPHLNPLGANRRQISAAVNAIEEVGCPDRYFAVAEAYARSGGFAERSVAVLPLQVRLALEIAANEESERRALEGELGLLERAWRDAEEIAALADDLVVPTPLLARLRRGIISD